MATQIKTEIPGNIWKILVSVGDTVEVGQTLFIMELMKTEVPHASTVAGQVESIHISEGQEVVEAGEIAIVIV